MASVSLSRSGQEVASLDCDAPWILFKPAPGQYTATASLIGGSGRTRSANFTTNGTGAQKEITIVLAPPTQAAGQ